MEIFENKDYESLKKKLWILKKLRYERFYNMIALNKKKSCKN